MPPNKFAPFLKIFLLSLASLFIAAVVFLTLRCAVRQPFHLDEAEEATMGLKLATIGAKTFLSVPEGGMPVTHALLYTFTQGLVQYFFGPGEFALRMYGVFHFILSLLIMLLIIRELIDGERRFRILGMVIGGALYIVNPLLLQHSVIINADNNILTTAILCFIYFFVRFEKRPLSAGQINLKNRAYVLSRLILALLLTLCFWSKELTPAFMLIGILLYRLINRDFKRMLIDFFLVGCLGFICFWLTWWLYCAMTGTDVFGFLKFTILGKGKLAFSGNYLSGILRVAFYGFRWHIYWASFMFFAAVCMFAVKRAAYFFKEKTLGLVDLIFLCAASIWIPFQFFRPTIDMVKYHYPAYPLLIAAAAWFFNQIFKETTPQKRLIPSLTAVAIGLILFGIVTLHYYLLGDYLLALWDPLYKHLNYHFLWYYYLPLAALLAVVAIGSGNARRFSNLAVVCVLFVVPVNLALDLNQAKANYATAEIWLNYGEEGLRETAQYLKQNIKDGDTVAVRQDLEYYLIHRYGIKIKQNLSPDKLLKIDDPRLLLAVFSQSPLKIIVVDKISLAGGQNLSPALPQLIEKFFVFDKKIGSFFIYKRKVI